MRGFGGSDGLGRTVRSVDGNGNATDTTYDTVVPLAGFGDVVETAVADALDHVNARRTDGAGRTLETEDAEGFLTTFQYDANGNRIGYRDANGIGEDCTFDARNRDPCAEDTEGDETRRDYDAHNNVIARYDGFDHVDTCVFDARDRKVACTDRILATTTFAYDGNNNLLRITDAEGGITTYAYDALGRQREVRYPNGTVTTTEYDSRSRPTLVETTDAHGDPLARTEYTLDAAGNRTRLTELERTVDYSYDALYRLTGETVADAEARAQGKALEDHATHLLVHGTLHLLGYDHMAEAEAEAMEALERRVLAGLGIADPYAGEAAAAADAADPYAAETASAGGGS